MNEFFVASGRGVLLELNHNNITVIQLKMHNFDKWSVPAQIIKEYLKTHSDDITKLLLEKTEEVMSLISLSIDHDLNDIERIMLQERDRSFVLVHAVIKLNDAFFSEPDPKHDDSVDPRNKPTWFDAFQVLISHGHTNAEIMQMSYGAFRHYLKAAQKRERREILNGAYAFRGGSIPSKKGFDDFKKDLEK